MSGRVVSADTNSSRNVNGLKNSSSYEPTGEKSLEIDGVYAEKIKVRVYVNQQNSVSQFIIFKFEIMHDWSNLIG